jgi:tetratricopeptide (TPR) repeat protein
MILRELAISYNNLYTLYSDQGRYPEAEQPLRQSLAIRREVVSRIPFQIEDRLYLAGSHHNLSRWLRSTGQLDQAETPGRTSVELYEALVKEYPAQPIYRNKLANALHGLSILLWHMGRRDETKPLIERALALSEGVAAESPRVPNYRHKISDIYMTIAKFSWEAGRYADALRARRGCLEQHETLEFGHPARDYEKHVATHQKILATMLTRCPEDKLRDPIEAVRLARAAVTVLPQTGDSWRALGEALYRQGRWDEAVESLEKALALADTKDSVDVHLLLAMSEWRRGRRDQATHRYCRVQESLHDNRRHDSKPAMVVGTEIYLSPAAAEEGLLRLENEAVALLGLAERSNLRIKEQRSRTRK